MARASQIRPPSSVLLSTFLSSKHLQNSPLSSEPKGQMISWSSQTCHVCHNSTIWPGTHLCTFLDSYYYDKHHDLRRQWIYFTFQLPSHTITGGTQSRNLETGTNPEAVAMPHTASSVWLAPLPSLNSPGPPAHGRYHRKWASASHTNQENVSPDLPTSNLDGGIFSDQVILAREL